MPRRRPPPSRSRPRTRALFLLYTEKARSQYVPWVERGSWRWWTLGLANQPEPQPVDGFDGEQVNRESARFWNRMTAARKAEFVRLYNAQAEAKEARNRPRVAALRLAADARMTLQVLPGQQIDWRKVIRTHRRATPEIHTLIPLQRAVLNATRALTDFILELNPHVDVYMFAGGEVIEEEMELEDIQQAAQHYQHIERNPPVPPRADGRVKIFKDAVPNDWLWEPDRQARAAFWNEDPEFVDPDAEELELWLGGWAIGNPGMSTTGLWVRIEEEELRVIDRVLRKDTYCSGGHWVDARWWQNNVLPGDVLDGRHRLPVETACHYDLQGIPSPTIANRVNVARLRRHYVNNALRRYSMYLDFCGHGDLGELIGMYNTEETRIPEPFLWRTFQSLVKVGMAMQTGHAGLSATPTENWKEIVHRDLKPRNVFLDTPTPGHFASYPTPKLGDFGLAIRTTQTDVLNPQIYNEGAGTRGYLAPEQREYVDMRTMHPVDDFKLLSKTNVWGVGMIMYALAAKVEYPQQRSFLGEGTEDAYEFGAIAIRYSERLADLIRRCIQFNPNDRPTFWELWTHILGAIANNLTEGMQDRADLSQTAPLDLRRLKRKRDRYAVGLTTDDLPLPPGPHPAEEE